MVRYADDIVAADPAVDRGGVMEGFYADSSIVNLLTLLIQVFLVARILRWIGVSGAILVSRLSPYLAMAWWCSYLYPGSSEW